MLEANVAAVRRFSRYYTRRIGVLEASLLGSGLTLPQGRLLYEIASSPGGKATPGALAALLGLDAGYVSRLVAALEAQDLVQRASSASDGRSVLLSLTPAGAQAFAGMDGRSRAEVATLLAALPAAGQRRIVEAMQLIERELEPTPRDARGRPAVSLREPRVGDIGWVVHRHGALYHEEYGWDWTFEALVAGIAGEFIQRFDPARDCCRIAEAEGKIVGSSFVVRTDKPGVAKLRLVYVEPTLRGAGVGQALVEDCMAFARRAGYARLTLWTNVVLVAARRLYERLGFTMLVAEPVTQFGHAMLSETWEREL